MGPLDKVKSRFRNKKRLVEAVEKLTQVDGFWIDRVSPSKGLGRVSNKKLLKLHDQLADAHKRFSSREGLVDEILRLRKRTKDVDLKKKMMRAPFRQLLDILSREERRNQHAVAASDPHHRHGEKGWYDVKLSQHAQATNLPLSFTEGKDPNLLVRTTGPLFECKIEALEIHAQGKTEKEAVMRAFDELVTLAARLFARTPARLSVSQREKRRWLADYLDLEASDLFGIAGTSRWILGRLKLHNGKWQLVRPEEDESTLELAAGVVQPTFQDGVLAFARTRIARDGGYGSVDAVRVVSPEKRGLLEITD